MKLSELNPQDIEVVSHPDANQGGLKLSQLHPDDVEHVSQDESQEEAPGYIESAGRGAVQGATLGYSDELAGALQAAASPVQILQAPDSTAKLKELYQKYRDIERTKNEAAEKANPKTYLAGNIVGGVAGTLTGADELAAGVKGSALLGAAAGLGTSNADLTESQYGRAAFDTGLGGALGGLAGKAGQKIGEFLSPSALKQSAAESVGNVVGAKGLPSARQKVGEAIIKSGGLKEGTSEASLNLLRKASVDTEKEFQPLLAKIATGLSDKSPEEISSAVGGDAGDKVLGLIDNALGSMKDMSSDVTNDFANNIAPKMQDYVLKLKEAGNDPVRLNEIKRAAYQQAQEIYEKVSKAQRTGQAIPPEFEQWGVMAKQIGETIKDHIEDLAKVADPQGSLLQGLQDSNRLAGGLAGAKSALTSKLVKEVPTRLSHPISYAKYPLFSALTDATRNLGEGVNAAKLAKAGAQTKLANFLEPKVGEALSGPAAQGAELAIRSTPMLESVQKGTGGAEPKKAYDENPAEYSRSLYSQSDDQLKNVAQALSQSANYKHVGSALSNAINNKDVQAKNAALYIVSSNPQIKKVLSDNHVGSE